MAIAADCKSAPSGFGGSSPPPPTQSSTFPRREKGGVPVQTERKEKLVFFSEVQPGNPQKSEIFAEVAQLVEHQPSKLRVASSNLVFRSNRLSRCSSGVERILGKDEVMSSIPITGSFFGFRPF